MKPYRFILTLGGKAGASQHDQHNGGAAESLGEAKPIEERFHNIINVSVVRVNFYGFGVVGVGVAGGT